MIADIVLKLQHGTEMTRSEVDAGHDRDAVRKSESSKQCGFSVKPGTKGGD